MSPHELQLNVSRILQQYKASYAMLDKNTGQVLGYAFITADKTVTADDIKLENIPREKEVQKQVLHDSGDEHIVHPQQEAQHNRSYTADFGPPHPM